MRLLQKTLTAVAGALAMSVWGCIIYWQVETPVPFDPQVEFVVSDGHQPVQLVVPPLPPGGKYTLEIYSTVTARSWLDAQTGREAKPLGLHELSTPVMVYRRGISEWTHLTIPPVLGKGAYTVVLHVSYSLNALRRVEQSALIAVVLVR